MKRLALIAGVHFALCGLWAQERISQFTVVSDYPQVRFRVDGKEYRGSVTFMWLEGTRHTLQYEGREDGYQYDGLETTRWNFAGWEESTGLLFQPALKTQMIIASPEITSFKLKKIFQ